ncbi:DUF1850 domain-containing protein [Thorsellia kenyensis]|uniref:DUF1850 domain-containing protein n=1 Tax=Thorsellia kenyensis TaxID=1549888 RepID=A0ABV6C6F3_9GAMM
MQINLGALLLICSHSMEEPNLTYAHCNVVHSKPNTSAFVYNNLPAYSTLKLSWTHSVEKIEWHESYILDNYQFFLDEVRLKGSGAGMEIPNEAIFKESYWIHYPNTNLGQLSLTYSPYTPDYQLCIAQRCANLFDWMAKNFETHLSSELSYRVSIEVFSHINFNL